ncbi:MAG: hypothetical protein CSB47_11410 [Proteobacteria bacterium]|nr:MAG: hypothetical protein CSB47_11410 [Pseudomonadota bacterium]
MQIAEFEPVKLIKSSKNLLVLAVISALSFGCINDDKNNKEERSLSGSVAKGIVKNGTVTAYPLASDGTRGKTAVGTAKTADDGSYKLALTDDYDGTSPLLLELTANSDTTMVCDALSGCGDTPRGDDIPLADTDFILTAVIPSGRAKNGAKVDTAITAFTSMAANRVVSEGNISDSSIRATNSKINELVGVNILSTNPVNIASKDDLSKAAPDEQRYAIMLAALAEQAFTGIESRVIALK